MCFAQHCFVSGHKLTDAFFTLKKALNHFTTFHHLGLSLTQSFPTLSPAAYKEPPISMAGLSGLSHQCVWAAGWWGQTGAGLAR